MTSTDAIPTESRPDPTVFEPGSLLWEGAGDRRMMLVLGGALIMQTMHPAIGHAVGERSVYKTDPWGRLERSLTSLQKWVYAGPGAIVEGQRLRKLHSSFKGVDDDGRSYRALDPEPWAWVHLTAHERAMTMNRSFVGDMTSLEDERRVYREILQLGRILAVPEEMLPPTVEDYWRYFDDMVATKLVAHPTAVDVLDRMLKTPAPKSMPRAIRSLWKPFGWSSGHFQHFVTVGTFPPAVREILGLPWSSDDERKLRRIGRVITRAFPRLPERIRFMPIAYQARREARTGVA